MKLAKLGLEIALIAGLSFVSPGGYERKVNSVPFSSLTLELVDIHEEENGIRNTEVLYSVPFNGIKGQKVLPPEDSIIPTINEKASQFLEKTLVSAEDIYKKEKKTREENADLICLIQEYNSELATPEKKYERMRLNRMNGIQLENSEWVEGKKVYAPEKEECKKEVKTFLDSLEYFGAAFLMKDHLFYNQKKAKEFMKEGLKPIDCTSFMLESMSRAQKRNFHLASLSRASQISDFLKKKGFETIYLAENTQDTSREYFYGAEKKFYTGDFIKK